MFLRQHVRQETIRECGPGMEVPDHVRLLDGDDSAGGHRRRSGHPLRLARKATLAEEMASIEHRDDGLFARVRQDRKAHGAVLDIHDARGRIALRKDRRRGPVLEALCSHARPIELAGGFGRRWALRLAHSTLPPLAEGASLTGVDD